MTDDLTLKLQKWIKTNAGRGAGNCQCQYCFTWRCAIYELKEILGVYK